MITARTGFTVLGVNILDSSRQSALDFVEELGINYPNGEDIGQVIANAYRVEAPPESFLIDRNGDIRQFYIGSVRYDDVSGTIEALLAEDL